MLEASWIAFYLILHLLVSVFILPLLLAVGKRWPHPQWMLRLWSFAAIIVVVLPLLLLQPWAIDRQVLPWFHGSVQFLNNAPQLVTTDRFEPAGSRDMSADPSFAANDKDLRQQALAKDSEAVKVTQYRWPVFSQVLYWLSPGVWLWLIIPLGVGWQLLRLLASYWLSRLIRQQTTPLFHSVAPTLVLQLEQQTSLPIRVHQEVASAMLLGLRQPMIVLPQSYLHQCSILELELIVQHEHMHYLQKDLYYYSFQQVVGCLFWWSPAWALMSRQLEQWRELRCDQRVSASLAEPSLYAQTLLDCAMRVQAGKTQTVSALLVQRWLQPSLLALRIDAVLSCQPPQKPWHFRTLCFCGFCICLGIFWLAQRWQLADLPAKHAQVRLSQLQPLASLLQAVAANDRAEVIRLLDQGAPLNLAMPGEGSALMVAVNHGLFEQVELLLARGADVEVSSRGDGNALIIAASRGDLQLAKRLLDAGANVNAAVLADETALINASYRDDFAMVQLLLNHGADINLQVETPISDGPEIRSPLSRARTPEMRKYLIAKGAR